MVYTEETPLMARLKAPAMFTQPGVEKMAGETLLDSDATFPSCAFTKALSDKVAPRRLPQAIAHRGYKAKFPENTMGAFAGAVEIGAHAIETDVHITKDDTVVLSHDATLKRCFGKSDKIIECNWSYISTLKTVEEPRQHMPRLKDLLKYLAKPGLEEVWLLLDIKLDNDSDDIMRLIADTIDSVDAPSAYPWQSRVVLGCWAAKYLPLAHHYLPGFPVTHIGFSTSYARQFLKVPNVSFNMLLPILMAPGGDKFIKEVHAAGRPVFAWTVNVEEKMEWCIRRNLDGVLTDDPKLYLEVCDRFDGSKPERSIPLKAILEALQVWIMAYVFSFLYKSKVARVSQRSRAMRSD